MSARPPRSPIPYPSWPPRHAPTAPNMMTSRMSRRPFAAKADAAKYIVSAGIGTPMLSMPMLSGTTQYPRVDTSMRAQSGTIHRTRASSVARRPKAVKADGLITRPGVATCDRPPQLDFRELSSRPSEHEAQFARERDELEALANPTFDRLRAVRVDARRDSVLLARRPNVLDRLDDARVVA